MTTYYLDFVNGSDANNGLGPDASHASNKPWKTIGKALGASGMASGDTAYLSPAGPFRETVSVAMTSAVAETKLIGDVANEQGFKTSGGVRVTPGEVQWTAYTTNDTTAAAASPTLTLSAADFLTFQKIVFVGGNAAGHCVLANVASSTDITFTDCTFIGHQVSANSVVVAATFGVVMNWLFDRCRFLRATNSAFINITLPTGTGSDYDANIVVRNSLFVGPGNSSCVRVTSSGASAQEGGGVDVINCTSFSEGSLLDTSASTRVGGAAFSVPCTAYNNFVMSGNNVSLAAGEVGAVVEDYNLLIAPTARSNVTAGANSVSDGSRPALVHLGQEINWFGRVRPLGMPAPGSPLRGFGGSSPPSTDILGVPRPAGGASASAAVGAYERNDSFGKETSTVRTGSNAISITGPGTQDFELAVDAASTTVTVYVRWDATYAGTKPQMKVLRGTEAGVSDASTTATGSSGAWEQLSLNFTPARAGIVTIRLQSNDTNGGGKMFADDWAVT